MASGDMSKRTHLWIRLAALAVIAAAAYFPRGSNAPVAPAPPSAITAESPVVQASVASTSPLAAR